VRHCFAIATVLGFAAITPAADNELTAAEKADGWRLLFDGKSLNGWKTSSDKPGKTPVDDGCINPHKCGGYMMVHDEVQGYRTTGGVIPWSTCSM